MAERPSLRFWPQLRATIVRNLLLKKRDTRKTLAETTLPLYSLAVLILLKLLVPNPNFPEVHTPGPGVVPTSYFGDGNLTVAVVPHNWEQPEGTTDFLKKVNLVVESLGNLPVRWVMYNTPEQLLEAYLNKPRSFPIAVIFETDPSSNDQPLRYTIRTNPSSSSSPSTRNLFTSPAKCRENQNDWSSGPLIPLDISKYHLGDVCPATQYFYSGFVALQTVIDYTKIMIDTHSQVRLPQAVLRMFPKRAHTGDWLVIFRVIMPMYMVMTLSQFITYFLMMVVGEKETKVREGMRIMGLKDSVYWWSWFVIYGVFVFVLALVSTVLLFTLRVFQHSSYILIFLLMLLFGFTIITFAFMLTPFFDKARTAGILGSFAINLMSALYFIQVFVTNADSLAFWFVSLISSSCYALAIDKALVLDMAGVGVTWENVWSGPGVPFGGSLIMMAVDMVLYALLAYYLDCVMPSEYGVKHKPWFCLMPSFWCRKNRHRTLSTSTGHYHANGTDSVAQNNNDIEPVPRELQDKVAIKIVSLHKSFKKQCRRPEVKAINGINLSIYEGQITAILGHNGAGKSTLFNILTGLTAPTQGTAYIYGLDVRDRNDMDEIRQMTGVCPQHDVLFNLLTVKEHLEFFASVKGIPYKRRSKEVERAMSEVNLTDQANTFSKNLSGGQKRKLSIAIAIIGDPKIIILDEPTAGVDPISRRQTWRILQRIRPGRVLLLTTHFMDEADILGDRKAVISKGKVRCAGTSLFLKNKFGIGYHLTLVLEGVCRENQITRLVRSHVPPAEKARRHGRELSYILPHNAVHHFAPLFEAIESEIRDKSNRLGITSYGVSMTTLEEVFLSLEGENEEIGEPMDGLSAKLVRARALSRSLSLQSKTLSYQELNDKESRTVELKPSGTTLTTPTPSIALHSTSHGIEHVKVETTDASVSVASLGENLKNRPNFLQTFRAMLWLRAIRMLRDPYKLYMMIFLPIISCAFGLYIKSHQIVIFRMQPLHLNASAYHNKTPIALSNSSLHDLTDLESSLRMLGVNPIGYFDGNFASLMDTEYFGAYGVASSNIPYANMLAYYNTSYTHSVPIIMNMLDNSIYRSWMQIHGNISRWKPIEVTAHPFQQTEQAEEFNLGNFTCALFMGMIFALVPVTLAVDIVYDREIKAKNQLRVNGLSMSMYFLTYFTILIIIMVIISAGVLLLVILNDIPSLSGRSSILMCAFLITLYCPAAILFNTCLSYVFDKMDSAQSIMPNITTWVGIVPFVIVAVLDAMKTSSMVAFGLHAFFSFADVMYIPYAIIYYVDKVYVKCHLRSHCDELSFESYFTPELWVLVAATAVQIPLWFLCLLVCDRLKSGATLREIMPCATSEKPFVDEETEETGDPTSDVEDEDVRRERRRAAEIVRSPRPNAPVLVVHNLRKEYTIRDAESCSCGGCGGRIDAPPARKTGVSRLSVAVEAGEVFGLLGHNGAGKSTTMKIITGEERPTQGTVMLGGQTLTSSAFDMLGYCPQHDALWKNITIREHLECYAAIRGVPPSELPRIVDAYLSGLQISEHAGKHADNCSGGTRRKLSFALAMVGNPRLVLLDEPSTGMDPRSKRFLWDTILATFQGKKGAVLTTHSMEEADALCSRVAIMVKGGLRCIGSTQHLKNSYGAGYTLEIKIGQSKKYTADNELSTGDAMPQSPTRNTARSLGEGDTGSEASPCRSGDAGDADVETDGVDVSIHTPLVGGRPDRRPAPATPLETSGADETLCGGAEACVALVLSIFPAAQLEENFADRLVFSVPQEAVTSLASCFRRIEQAKAQLNITEYSFSQTTLEQVFLKFAQTESSDGASEADH